MRPYMTTRKPARSFRSRFAVFALGAALAMPLAGAVAEESSDTITTTDAGFDAQFDAFEALPPAPVVEADAVDITAFQPPVEAEQPAPSPPVPTTNTRSLGSGVASYYGAKFHGRRTASGARFDMNAMTAAHKTLPFGTRVLVTNPRNGKSVTVTINDRGPYAHGRTIDLSKAAATEIGIIQRGHGTVELAVIS